MFKRICAEIGILIVISRRKSILNYPIIIFKLSLSFTFNSPTVLALICNYFEFKYNAQFKKILINSE